MIDDHEAMFGKVADRTVFDGEFVVPQHLRKANFQRQSSIMFLGTMSRSRTFLTLSKEKGYHGSVPDLTKLGGGNQTTKSLDITPKTRPSIAAIRENQPMHSRSVSTSGTQFKGAHPTVLEVKKKIPDSDTKTLLHSTSFSIKRPSLVSSKSTVSENSRLSRMSATSMLNINEIQDKSNPGWGQVRGSCSYLTEVNAFTLPRPKISINPKRNGDSAV